MSFQGTYTAIVTPFRHGKIDEEAFVGLIERQIAAGVDGIVPVGTTGESPTLSHDEHHEVIQLAIQAANKRCRIIAGTGSNATDEAVSLTVKAAEAGADGALLVAPYYNKPSQEGLFLHYQAIAKSCELPLVLYSIPGRCGIEIGVETVARLADACPNIVCIKEAGGSVERVSALKQVVPQGFTILSGDDSLTLPFMSVGASGVISVASNLIPAEVAELVSSFRQGNAARALELHTRLYPLFKNLFVEPNPVPVKHALARQGWIDPEVRLPLCPMTPANVTLIDRQLEALGLLA